MGTLLEKVVAPGQSARGVLTITNDGDIPARYAVEVSPGSTLLGFGFSSESTTTLVTNSVQPGSSTTVRIPLTIPSSTPEGRKPVRVRIGEAGTSGEIVRVLDEQVFSGRLRVAAPKAALVPPVEMVPLPGEPVIPSIQPPVQPQLPAGPTAFLPGDLSLQRPVVRFNTLNTGDDNTLKSGDTVSISLPFSNGAPVSFPVDAEVFILAPGLGFTHPTRQEAARLQQMSGRSDAVAELSGQRFSPTAGGSNTPRFSWRVPAEAPSGDYGLRVIVTDVNTNIEILTRDFFGLFSVETIPVSLAAIPAPALPEPEILEAAPATTLPEGLRPGQLTLLDQVPSLLIKVSPGDSVMFNPRFQAASIQLASIPRVCLEARVTRFNGVAVVDLAGVGSAPDVCFTIAPGTIESVDLSWVVPQDLPAVRYGVRIIAFDPDRRADFLVNEFLFPLVEVQAAPVEEPEPEPPTARTSGLLRLVSTTPSPSRVIKGSRVRIAFQVFNAGSVSPLTNVRVFILGPNRSSADLPVQTFRPGEETGSTVSIGWDVPSDAATGEYDVHLLVWDPNTLVPGDTSTFLINETVQNVFRVIPAISSTIE